MDSLTPIERSARMARVRQKNTRPELAVRRALHAEGYRFNVHRRDLPGTPDIVFPRRRKVIFVHGCFWHGHQCRAGRRPSTNAAFWDAKLSANMARDAAVEERLRAGGWKVMTVWACEIAKDGLAESLRAFLGSPGTGAPESVSRENGTSCGMLHSCS